MLTIHPALQAFCAGGDVKWAVQSIQQGRPQDATE